MIVILMGVTGSGKTTVGTLLAHKLHWQFADADDFHSAVNKDKIHRGIPLTDADRSPWLAAMRSQIDQWIAANQNAVLACSALKQSYRQLLGVAPAVKYVLLQGSYDLIHSRLLVRKGHFADEHILQSQFDTLEEPGDSLVVDIRSSPPEIVDEICRQLNLPNSQ